METREIILQDVRETEATMHRLGIPMPASAEAIAQIVGPKSMDTELMHAGMRLDYPIAAATGCYFERFDWAGLTHPQNSPPLRARIWNFVVASAFNWHSRAYEVDELEISDDAHLGADREHDFYPTLNGGRSKFFICRRGFSRNAGGQHIQTTQRESEGASLEPGGLILVEDRFVRNAGWNFEHGRNGFTFSYFDGQRWDGTHVPGSHDVVQRRCIVDKNMQEKSTGFLLIQSRKRASVSWQCFLAGELVQPFIKLEGEGDSCFLEHFVLYATGGQKWIDVSPGWEKVWIADFRGDAHVKREKKDLGPASEVQGWL